MDYTVYGVTKSQTRLSDFHFMGFPGGASGKEPACQCRRYKRCRFDPWVGKIPWKRKWQPTLVFLPGESHGLRSLAGYSPQGRKESDTTKATQHAHTFHRRENLEPRGSMLRGGPQSWSWFMTKPNAHHSQGSPSSPLHTANGKPSVSA